MQIQIGENIRKLRKRDGRTQEMLADALGVTGQAVSRWEANGSYPDMELVPAIANYFNVTIDELFGHSLTAKEQRYRELYDEYDRLAHRWEAPDTLIRLLRNALAEFPGDEKLLMALAKQLYYKFSSTVHGKVPEDGYWTPNYEKMRAQEGWEESEKIMLRLLETTQDKDIRESCHQLLVFLYDYIGELDKAKEIASQAGDIVCCKDELLEHINGEDGVQQGQINLMHYATWTFHKIKFSLTENRVPTEKRIAIREAYLSFLEILFDGTFGFHTIEMRWLHLDLAELYMTQKASDKALDHLRNACEYSLKFDEYLKKGEPIPYTSPYFALIEPSDPAEWTAVEQCPSTKDCLETAPIFAPLRELPEFTEILATLTP